MKSINHKVKLKKIIIITFVVLIILLIILVFFQNIINGRMELTEGNTVPISVPENGEKSSVKETRNNIFIDSIVLKNLINNNWDKIKSNLLQEENEGYNLNCIDIYVNSVVFNTDYKDSVVSDITVGTSLKKIRETLGTPYCENKELGMIGYKTQKIFIFFYNNEIAVYSNKYFYNVEFEELLFQYFDGQYDGNRTNFVVELRRKYPDFIAEMNNSSVILYSITRQIKIQLNQDETMGIYVYSGYNYGDLMNEYLDKGNIEVKEEDFIEEMEKERKKVSD